MDQVVIKFGLLRMILSHVHGMEVKQETVMRKRILVSAMALCGVLANAGELRDRWVYVTDSLLNKDCVSFVSNVLHDAKVGGMNGAVLSCGMEFYKFWPKVRRDRLARIKQICENFGLEIIPTMWSLGYGTMQNYGVNYLEGLPLDGVPYVAKGTNAVFDAARAEVFEIDATKGFQRTGGYCRLIKKVAVKPHARYRLSCEVRTSNLTGSNPFRVVVRNARAKAYYETAKMNLDVKPTQEWTDCQLEFNTSESDSYYLYVGYMSGWKTGDLESL